MYQELCLFALLKYRNTQLIEHWKRKFVNAGRGIQLGMLGQSSFHIHLPASVLVLALAWLLRCDFWQWCVLGLCISLVMSLELMNSAVEYLARGLCHETNRQVGAALDIASGAVLVACAGAAALGAAIFVCRIISLLGS